MTKEEIEHEKLWTEGIVSAVMLSSKGIVSDFISNLEKVGYKIVKSESENERLKAEREWIEIDPNVKNQIPDEDVWTYCIQTCDVDFTPKGDYIPLGTVSHYMRLVKPQPPKQSCPQCKTEYTKEELLTNEHCFKCGFEMKGF